MPVFPSVLVSPGPGLDATVLDVGNGTTSELIEPENDPFWDLFFDGLRTEGTA